MTDSFERAMADIAIKSAKNGGPTNSDILTALQATNEDLDATTAALSAKVEETHKETKAWHESVKVMVAAHIEESKVRDRRIADLELAEEDRRKNCIPTMQNIARELHDKAHSDYVSSLGESAFQSRLVYFFASNFGKFFLVVLGIVSGVLINLLVYGRP